MTPVRFGYWLGAGFISVTMALGCRHAHRQCHEIIVPCECCQEVVQPIPAKVQPAAVQMLPAFEKKDDRPNVAFRVVAPGMSPGSADMVGTDEMTAPEADKVGIRPGHTPGALWIPVSRQLPVVEKPQPQPAPAEQQA